MGQILSTLLPESYLPETGRLSALNALPTASVRAVTVGSGTQRSSVLVLLRGLWWDVRDRHAMARSLLKSSEAMMLSTPIVVRVVDFTAVIHVSGDKPA